MKVSDLKIKKSEISEELKVLRGLIDSENRPLTEEESTKVTELTRDLSSVESSISLIEKDEELSRSVVVEQPEVKKEMKNSLELVRHLADNNGQQSPEILDVNRELGEKIATQGVFISRNYSYGTNGVDLSPTRVGDLTVTEAAVSPKLWDRMGCTVYNGLKGGTQKLPFMSTMLAEEVAEKAGITRNTTGTSHVELTPVRVGIQIEVTREGLGSYSQSTWDGVMANVMKAIDRKITAKVYAAAFAGATAVAGVALDKDGFDDLEGSVPVDGIYMMNRKTFYEAKGVAIDTGSGKFLAMRESQDFGRTYEGTPIFHSGLFSDAANTKYVVYGVAGNIAIGFWGNDAYEVIVDPYTKADAGTLVITVSKLTDIKIPDAAVAFVKSPDLDPAA